MEKRGVTMETVVNESGITMYRQYYEGDGCYHRNSTMGERGVTLETVHWGVELPWRQHSGGERCYHGNSIVSESGVTMETVL